MVEKIYQSDQIIKYKISGKDVQLMIQSNEPLLKGKGLNRRRVNWKLIEGQHSYASFVESITKAIEALQKQNPF